MSDTAWWAVKVFAWTVIYLGLLAVMLTIAGLV